MTMISYDFYLTKLRCSRCVETVRKTLDTFISTHDLSGMSYHIDFPGVSPYKMRVSLPEEKDAALNVVPLIARAIERVGVGCKPDTGSKSSLRQSWFLSPLFLGLVGTCLGFLLMLSMMLFGPFSLLALGLIGAMSIALTFYLGASSYKEAYQKLVKGRRLTMDTLFAISTLTALAVSVAAFFIPGLPFLFDVGLMVFGFRYIGEAIKNSMIKTVVPVARFQDDLPSEVGVEAQNGNPCQRALNSIKPGQVVYIEPGMMIPMDGVSETDEPGMIIDAIVTGRNVPRTLKKGELLVAGMIVPSEAPRLRMRVSSTWDTSYLSTLDRDVATALQTRATLEETASKVLHYFIPMVLLLAIVSFCIIGHFFSLAVGLSCAMAVLVSACPCTLGLITPLSIKVGMQKAARYGVRFKAADALQVASTVDWVVFDFNGTLTLGVPAVKTCQVIEKDWSIAQILSYAASMEASSTHLVGKAICRYAEEKKIQPIYPGLMEECQFTSFGVSATIEKTPYCLGNKAMMEARGVEYTRFSLPTLHPGDSVLYFACGQQVVGYFILHDPLRPDAAEVVQALKKMGKKIAICSGGDEDTVKHGAQLIGVEIENVFAERVGERGRGEIPDKKECLSMLRLGGQRVAMVGDGGNDAPVISNSDFGIAMQSQHAHKVTIDAAHAVVQSGSLLPVANAFAIANATVNHIKQNIAFSVAYNMGTVLLAGGLLLLAGIVLNPAIGVALMVLQTSLILGSVYLFKKRGLIHLKSKGPATTIFGNSYQMIQQHLPQKVKDVCPVLEEMKPSMPTMTRNKVPAPLASSAVEAEENDLKLPPFPV